jgi:hypothetical protein
MARRIRVLPNMEGIIAEFDAIQVPTAVTEPRVLSAGSVSPEARAESSSWCNNFLEHKKGREWFVRPVPLRVWTSEGVDKAERPVCVVFREHKEVSDEPGDAMELGGVRSGNATGERPSWESGYREGVSTP